MVPVSWLCAALKNCSLLGDLSQADGNVPLKLLRDTSTKLMLSSSSPAVVEDIAAGRVTQRTSVSGAAVAQHNSMQLAVHPVAA